MQHKYALLSHTNLNLLVTFTVSYALQHCILTLCATYVFDGLRRNAVAPGAMQGEAP